MTLGSVNDLADDDAVAVAPTSESSKQPKPKAETSPKPKAKAKGKGRAKASPSKKVVKEKVVKEKVPKQKAPSKAAAPKTLKRPASASTKEPKPGTKRDPDHISTSKSQYKNGVYCIKLFGKQVITVAKLQ